MNGKKLVQYMMTFSKAITIAWLVIWIETIIFCQIAVVINFGDVNAIQSINENVIRIGEIICAFYFGTKCIENVARGIEDYLTDTAATQSKTLKNDDAAAVIIDIDIDSEPEAVNNEQEV